MKIPLNIDYEGRSMPNVLLIIFGPRTHIQIDAVVDTGSHFTILSYKDAELLQIPFKQKEQITRVQGTSKERVNICECNKPLKFLLKKEDGTLFKVAMDYAYISQEREGANITIIGTDFIKANNLKLIYDPNKE